MSKGQDKVPRLVVYTTLFPHHGQPNAGLFIRERMFRVGKILPLVVVVPVPWFPFQAIIRYWRPHFRPKAPAKDFQQGFEVYYPRFFSVPGLGKSLDGLFMALGSLLCLSKLKRQFGFNIIDAHFAYPDGYAATILGKWFKVPVTITLRGTEVSLSKYPARRKKIRKALLEAAQVFSVSSSLKRHVTSQGINENKIAVVGNGVDITRFHPVDRSAARGALGIPLDAKVLISVGGLAERKGFHRVIECLPELKKSAPDLRYLVVGGPCAEGDMSRQLREQILALDLEQNVKLLGALPPDQLKTPLSASDVFVLATRNEGWANVFLEAMACGLPVVTTNVGGNSEVVCRPELGILVTFGDRQALLNALAESLANDWDRQAIIAYARENTWEQRVRALTQAFHRLVGQTP
jgi:teichuronic acid biosynthesis glycosyltransferase TuaC